MFSILCIKDGFTEKTSVLRVLVYIIPTGVVFFLVMIGVD